MRLPWRKDDEVETPLQPADEPAEPDGWHNTTLIRYDRRIGPYSLGVWNQYSEDADGGPKKQWYWDIHSGRMVRDSFSRGEQQWEEIPGAVMIPNNNGRRGPFPCESLEDGKAKAVEAVRALVAEAMAVLTEAGIPLPIQAAE